MRQHDTDLAQKYRPRTLKECILPFSVGATIQRLLETSEIENLLLYGPYGVGKTTLSRVLCREWRIQEEDQYFVNGSLKNSINDLRSGVMQFASACARFGTKKVVILDEAERLSSEYQDGLRGFMEDMSHHCAFILTANNPDMISKALQSRCIGLDFGAKTDDEIVDMTIRFGRRVQTILTLEKKKLDPKRLTEILIETFPDFRQVLKRVQLEAET